MAWAMARARLQSVTIDEADSYLMFAFRGWPTVLDASSSNHVLNTLLAWTATSAFGLSHLTLRAPALTGAGIYIAASLLLCAGIRTWPSIQWPLFVCLVYNPFVMDYMVAARGYGLALGFMMATIWAIGDSRLVVASVCAGLSFCANFSFAWVAAALILVAAVEAWRRSGNWQGPAACLLPGATTALVICGWTLWHWPRGELYYGATHLSQMWDSLALATFDELNPVLVHPPLAAALEVLRPALAALLLGVAVWQAGRIVWFRHPLGLVLVLTTVIASAGHWLQFRLAGIPLPLARTGVFFVPLVLLLIGFGAALPSATRLGGMSRVSSIAVISLSAFWFVGCLRLSYFKEWRFAAEAKEAFVALERRHRQYPLREIGTDWRYADALNFYRECLHHHELGPFDGGEPLTPGKSAYVLYSPETDGFMRRQGLQVIYRGPLSDVVVVVRP